MDPARPQGTAGRRVWALAARQHGVVTRRQLLELEVHPDAIRHRLRAGRLHKLRAGVYAVGSPRVTLRGHWMAAVLYCGDGAVLSHASAAELWGIRRPARAPVGIIHVTVTNDVTRKAPGLRTHRPSLLLFEDRTARDRVPVTSPARTLIDLAAQLSAGHLEAAVNEADKLDLIDPEALRAAVDGHSRVRGARALRRLLDARTFALTDSELERWFLRLVGRAGLPRPCTGDRLNGFKVDFHWPALGLVVETDGLRYHRTPAQQARDRQRDHAHARAGLTQIRFTHAQVRFEPESVVATLRSVARRLAVQKSD
ncbi:MAG: type IV toxin-antitoxin system AbiEi family antitoxin domain-containing protein [Solirubrobacterales bacterium]